MIISDIIPRNLVTHTTYDDFAKYTEELDYSIEDLVDYVINQTDVFYWINLESVWGKIGFVWDEYNVKGHFQSSEIPFSYIPVIPDGYRIKDMTNLFSGIDITKYNTFDNRLVLLDSNFINLETLEYLHSDGGNTDSYYIEIHINNNKIKQDNVFNISKVNILIHGDLHNSYINFFSLYSGGHYILNYNNVNLIVNKNIYSNTYNTNFNIYSLYKDVDLREHINNFIYKISYSNPSPTKYYMNYCIINIDTINNEKYDSIILFSLDTSNANFKYNTINNYDKIIIPVNDNDQISKLNYPISKNYDKIELLNPNNYDYNIIGLCSTDTINIDNIEDFKEFIKLDIEDNKNFDFNEYFSTYHFENVIYTGDNVELYITNKRCFVEPTPKAINNAFDSNIILRLNNVDCFIENNKNNHCPIIVETTLKTASSYFYIIYENTNYNVFNGYYLYAKNLNIKVNEYFKDYSSITDYIFKVKYDSIFKTYCRVENLYSLSSQYIIDLQLTDDEIADSIIHCHTKTYIVSSNFANTNDKIYIQPTTYYSPKCFILGTNVDCVNFANINVDIIKMVIDGIQFDRMTRGYTFYIRQSYYNQLPQEYIDKLINNNWTINITVD